MSEDVLETITEFIDSEVRDLSDVDFVETLEEIISNLQSQVNCKREEWEDSE